MKEKLTNIFAGIIFFVFAYTAVSACAYAFRHPEKTQTQVLLDTPQAWMWR